jgi:polyhydroxyalkanoate synthesis regulator phasin
MKNWLWGVLIAVAGALAGGEMHKASEADRLSGRIDELEARVAQLRSEIGDVTP